MMKLMFLTIALIVSTVTMANEKIKLECRVDTLHNLSVPRFIVLDAGNGGDISCNVDSCQDKDLTIMMNYNSLYSEVSLKVWDIKTDQAIETSYPNLKLGSRIDFVVYRSQSPRFIKINCSVFEFIPKD